MDLPVNSISHQLWIEKNDLEIFFISVDRWDELITACFERIGIKVSTNDDLK